MSCTFLHRVCYGVLAFSLLFIGWEIAGRYSGTLAFVLPLPTKIAHTLWVQSDRFLFHAWSTFKEMLGGFVLAFVVAFPFAWLMAYFGSLRAVMQPFFIAVQCIPMFALAPIMVLWFGWTYTAIIVPTALMIFFPLTMNIYQGLCSTPKNLLDFFRLHEATRWQLFVKLQLPWALPHVFSGFRIAVALAGIGAVAGEWAGAQKGLGLLMLESRRSADMEMMFGALVCLTVLSLTMYAIAVFLEQKIGARHHKKGSIPSALGCVFTMLMLTGCQQQGDLNETKLVLDWLPNPNHVALYAGVEKGFFEEQGIRLRILKIADPSDSVPFLTSGQSDLSLTYMPHTIHALSRGAKVSPIGILIEEPLNGIIYRKGEGINSPENLNGRTVGYCVDGYHINFLLAMFENRKILPKEYLNVSFDLVGSLALKHVDMLYGAYWNIECENLREHGIETDYFPLSSFGVPPYYELIFLARDDSEQAKPSFINAFQAALQKSIDYSAANPKEAFDLYIKANPDKSLKTKQWEYRAWLITIPTLARQQAMDPVLWGTFVSWLIEKGLYQSQSGS